MKDNLFLFHTEGAYFGLSQVALVYQGTAYFRGKSWHFLLPGQCFNLASPIYRFFFILTTQIITMEAVISKPFRNSQVYRNRMLFRDQNNARQLTGTGYLVSPSAGVFIALLHRDTYHLTPSQVPCLLLQYFSNLPANLFHFHRAHNFLCFPSLCVLPIQYLLFESSKIPTPLH